MSTPLGDPLRPGVWVFESAPVTTTVVRLSSGALWIHAPPEPTEAFIEAVDALGPVAWLVAGSPSAAAHLAAAHAQWPSARCAGVHTIATGGPPTARLDGAAQLDWIDQIAVALFDANTVCEAIFTHVPTGTIIVGGTQILHPTLRTRLAFFGFRRTACASVVAIDALQPTGAVLPQGWSRAGVDAVWDGLRWLGADGPIPPLMRPFFGREPGGLGAGLVVAALVLGALLGFDLSAASPVQRWVGALVLADIAAGAVALHLPSTRAWWRVRGALPQTLFLAVHLVHALLLSWAYGGSGLWALWLWGGAAVGAGVVALAGRDSGGIVAVFVLLVGIFAAQSAPGPLPWMAALLLVKLVLGFGRGLVSPQPTA